MTDKLIHFVEEEILHGEEKVTVEDDLLTTGLVDSMGMMRLIAYVEEEYNLSIPPQDLVIENFVTIGAMVAYLKSRK